MINQKYYIQKACFLILGCATSAVYCGFADIFLLGACSATNLAVCGTMIATMEIAVSATDLKYETFLSTTQLALTVAGRIQDEQKSLEKYLNRETKVLTNLDTSLGRVRSELKLSKTIFKVDIPTLRRNYLEALDELDTDAQAYLDQKELE